MSGTEILIILVVGIIVVGPKKLPGMMRTAGRWIARARRMTTEVRAQSGIDKLIREEGLENEIRELSSLARSNVLSRLVENPLADTERQINTFARSRIDAGDTKRAPSPAVPDEEKPKLPASTNGAPASPSAEAATGPSKSALDLIKPPVGSVSRRNHDEALRALLASAGSQGLFSIREREYPTIGCDSYDCMPDDIDDPEAYANEPEPAPAPALTAPEVAAEASKEPA